MASSEGSSGMAAAASPEKSAAAAGAGRSGGTGPGDSYIGSLISLTSKSEIRYEGILYTINTEESSIGLRNVRSFGTEGRKKDGPQILASEKIYEYILFRGSDIKDLQVKSSAPVQPVQPAAPNNDPAIIQSHYSRPPPPATASMTSSFATGPNTSPLTADLPPPHASHATAQFGSGLQQQRAPFQGTLPLYQPGSGLPSWGPQAAPPQPPTANGSGLTLPPVYWQGYYPPPTGFPNMPPPAQIQQQPQMQQQHQIPLPQLPQLPQQQPSLIRAPPGVSIPNSLQYPNLLNSGSQNLPELPPSVQQQLGGSTSTLNLSSVSLPTTVAPTSAPNVSVSDTTPANLIPSKPLASSISGFSPPNLGAALSMAAPLEPSAPPLSTNKPASSSSSLLSQNVPQGLSTVEQIVPLVTPGQLLQTTPATTSSSVPISTLPVQSIPKELDVKTVEISEKVEAKLTVEMNKSGPILADPIVESKRDEPLLPEPPIQVASETKEPLLPSPMPSPYKTGGGVSYGHHHNYNNYRGRGRGRGPSAFSRHVTKFTEDFDFTAMNEKFNKDEVWGHLGKNKESDDFEGDETLDEEESEVPKIDVKPVYVKDDFFDSLSCTSLDQNSRNGRPRFSEQLKIDTETFGNFPRHHRGGYRGGRGPRGGYRGGMSGRGGSYYNNRGYGGSYNSGRGSRAPNYNNHTS